MTHLSVNVIKIATIRNARGGETPNLIDLASLIQRTGADGITVHPRPDERHIRYSDVYALKKVITTEINIEGNPRENKFIDLVLDVVPDQVTLVPDNNNQLTSDHGWNTIAEKEFLQGIIQVFKSKGIRTSIFVNANIEMINGAAQTGTDRIELYTESYAKNYSTNKEAAIDPFIKSAELANELKIGINAGHDLDLENLRFFHDRIPNLLEVSIGHALISDALLYGIEKTILMYQNELGK